MKTVRMSHIVHPLCSFLANCGYDDEEAWLLFKLGLRCLHPEIATAALVLLCQVVLLCKYNSSAVFFWSRCRIFLSWRLNFSFFLCVMQRRSYSWRGGSVIFNTVLFGALHQCTPAFICTVHLSINLMRVKLNLWEEICKTGQHVHVSKLRCVFLHQAVSWKYRSGCFLNIANLRFVLCLAEQIGQAALWLPPGFPRRPSGRLI